MKIILLLVVALTLVALVHSSHLLPDEVHDELQSYARQRASTIRMMRGGPSLQCYDQYIPQVTSVATNGKTDTQTCISRADTQKDDALNKVKDKREELDAAVQILQNSFTACIAKTDVIEYMRCLKDATAVNQAAFAAIESTSTSLSEDLDSAYKSIETAENGCIGSIITKAKQDTDQIFEALQLCLINGFEVPQPQPDPEPVEPQPEPQPDPVPEEPQPQPEEPKPQPEPVPEEPQSQPDPVPVEPQPQPEEPQPQPEEPQPQPEEPQPQPEEPQAQPEEPQSQPEEPQPQPEEPQPQPEEPQPQPEEPQPQPEEPQPQPEEPQPQPEEPQPQPEEPQAQPEEPQPNQPELDEYPEADI